MKLQNYRVFDTQSFLKGKKFAYLKSSYQDNEKFKGVSITALILEADDGNVGETLTIKVGNAKEGSTANIRPLTPMVIEEVEKASVFGEYQNQLSIIANVRFLNGAK